MRRRWAIVGVGLTLACGLGSCGRRGDAGPVTTRTPDAGPNSASIAGSVVDEDGHPVTGYDLDVIPDGQRDQARPLRWTVHVTGRDFSVGGLARGGYLVAARTRDHRMGGVALVEPRELGDGDHVARLTIHVQGGLWLHGVVVDFDSGAPVAGALLRAENGSTCRDCSRSYATSAVSGADGSFELAGLTAASFVHRDLGMALGIEADGYLRNDQVIAVPYSSAQVLARTARFQLMRGVFSTGTPGRSVLDGHVEVDGIHVSPYGDRSPFVSDAAGREQVLLRVDGVDVTALGFLGAEALIERAHGRPTTLSLRTLVPDGGARPTEQVVTMR